MNKEAQTQALICEVDFWRDFRASNEMCKMTGDTKSTKNDEGFISIEANVPRPFAHFVGRGASDIKCAIVLRGKTLMNWS